MLSTATATGQVPNPDHYLPSPNMASLGEYGSVPISLFTGIQSISVPIYTLQSRGHSLPVSLIYHGGGVQPDRHPGWTGLGWTLLAGGSITRVVNDLPDESNCYNLHDISVRKFSMCEKMGVFYNRNYQSLYTTFAPFSFVQYSPTGGNFDLISVSQHDLARRNHCRYDTEPDLFRFEAPGLSGYFYFAGNDSRPGEGNWRVVCDRPVQVVFDLNDRNNFRRPFSNITISQDFFDMRSESINNFQLIDDKGTVYTFGSKDPKDHSAVEYSVGFFTQEKEEMAAVAWHLTSIKYTDGTEIKFKYEKKDFVAQFGVTEVYTRETYSIDYHFNRYNGQPTDGTLGQMCVAPFYGFAQGSLLVPSYLKEIEMGETRLEFQAEESKELRYDPELYYDMHYMGCEPASKENMPYLQRLTVNETHPTQLYPGFSCFEALKWYKLKSILIKKNDTSGKVLKRYDLGYNVDDVSRQGKERLALLSVTEKGPGGETGARHTFEYDRLEQLPPYCSYDVDHWGFYKKTGIATIETGTNGDRYYNRKIRSFDVEKDSSLTSSGELFPLDSIVLKRRISTDRNHDKRTEYERARDASTLTSTIGSLMRVNYPTGGYTRFEYENHDYRASVDTLRTRLIEHPSPQIAGGLRVKSIFRSYDGVTESLYRSYKYSDFSDSKLSQSSGILMNPRQYYLVLYNNNVRDSFFDLKSAVTRVFNTQSVYPRAADGDGAEVGYSAVTEIFPDGSMTVHRFTNHDNGHSDALVTDFPRGGLSAYFPYISKAMERGLLTKSTHYDKDSIQVQVETTSYEPDDVYLRKTANGEPSQLHMAKIFNHCVTIELPKTYFHNQAEVNLKEVFPRKIYTYRMRPVNHTVTEYQNGVPVSSSGQTTSYSKRYNLPVEVTTTHSDLSYERNETRYLFDYAGTNTVETLDILSRANALSHPSQISVYSYNQDGVKTDLQQTSFTYSPHIISSPVGVTMQNSPAAPKDSVTISYISGDRPVCVKDENTGVSTVYVWGYKSEHIVAKIVNADINTVERYIGSLEDFAKREVPDFISLVQMNNSLSATVTMTIYKYFPGIGVSEQIASDGTRIYYNYDGFGRLMYATDQNYDVIEVYDYNYSKTTTSTAP